MFLFASGDIFTMYSSTIVNDLMAGRLGASR